MPYRQNIAGAYDSGVTEEYNRLVSSPASEAEYRLITGLIDRHIAWNSTVIDIGSGPGRYAEYLLMRNCRVGVADLSARSLKAFSDRINGKNYGNNLIFNKVCCATLLDWIPSQSADAILLMGPMYHLIEKEHRNAALEHSRRILKTGGYLFTVFLSLFLPGGNTEIGSEEIKSRNPLITSTMFKGYEVPQFRCHPLTAKTIMEDAGFETVSMYGLDSPFSGAPDTDIILSQLSAGKAVNELSGRARQYIHIGRLP